VGVFIVALMLCRTMLAVATGRAEEPSRPEEPKKADEPEKLQFTAQVDFLNQYVFRGVALSRGSLVMQPFSTLSYRGVTFNVWGNLDTFEQNPFGFKKPNRQAGRWNETDLTLSYTREVLKNLNLTGGIIGYILESNNSQFDSVELYGGFGYKTPWFEFGFAAYREVSHFPGTYLQWYVTRSFDLPWYGLSLDLWASWGAELSNDRAAFPIPTSTAGVFKNQFYQGFHAGHLMATLNIPLGKYVKISPKVMYWYALGGDATAVIGGRGPNPGLSWDQRHNHVLGGATVAVSF
jgi:hypothetical protein